MDCVLRPFSAGVLDSCLRRRPFFMHNPGFLAQPPELGPYHGPCAPRSLCNFFLIYYPSCYPDCDSDRTIITSIGLLEQQVIGRPLCAHNLLAESTSTKHLWSPPARSRPDSRNGCDGPREWQRALEWYVHQTACSTINCHQGDRHGGIS
jgi:hypothetical protein